MKTSLLLMMALGGFSLVARAQDSLLDPLLPLALTDAPQPGRTPPQGQQGPWQNDVIVYHAKADGSAERLATFERAGVPTINRMQDGRLIAAHQHFPENDPASFDKVAIHFSSDEGKTWTPPVVMKLNGLPEGMRFPFDPTLVSLPDGRVRMYFTSLRGRQFDEDLPRIHSAISTDGIEYTFEPGVRFSIEGRTVIDCAVALHNGVFHLYSPDNGAQPQRAERRGQAPEMKSNDGVGYHATSTDGLTFTRVEDVKVDGHRHWLGNAQSDGKIITFFGTGESRAADPDRPRGGFFMATSADGTAWQIVDSLGVTGADPGAVSDGAGGWILVVTGPPRDGRGRTSPSDRDDDWLRQWANEILLDQALRPPPAREARDQFPPARNRTSSMLNGGQADWAAFWSQGKAEGKGPVLFSHLPMRFEDIDKFVPYGPWWAAMSAR